MKITIYSGYNNGLGDLSFGKKLAMMIKSTHPDAEIDLVTSSREKLRGKRTGLTDVDKFNEKSDFKFRPQSSFGQ